MSCTIEEVPFDPTDWDKSLGDLLIQQDGDVAAFLMTIFGFLKRKTNFMKTDDPGKRVMDVFKEVSGLGLKAGFLGGKPVAKEAAGSSSQPTSNSGAATAPAAPPPAASAAAALPAAAAAAAAAAPSTSTVAAGAAAGASGSGGAAPAAAPALAASEPSPAQVEEALAAEEDGDDKPKGLKPNAGRGCDYGHYSWTQTLQEVSVTVPMPPGTKSKMCDVLIAKNKVRVGIKGQPPILEGEFTEPVKADDSIWNFEGGTVELTLSKAEGMHWWSAVVKGDPVIDTQKVEPENSKLTDLDAETRQTVEKMMFDQRQKAMGLPTSEEMQRQEMLKKFMASHPEMDFSNAKIM